MCLGSLQRVEYVGKEEMRIQVSVQNRPSGLSHQCFALSRSMIPNQPLIPHSNANVDILPVRWLGPVAQRGNQFRTFINNINVLFNQPL